MMSSWASLPAEGDGRFASDFIPVSHRHLPMLRVLLPLIDANGRDVRWSEFVSLDDAASSLSWWEVVDRVADDRPEVRDLSSCAGVLDAGMADALRDATRDVELTCLRWTGYGERSLTSAPERIYGNEYYSAPLEDEDLRAGEHVPEFAWDDDGTFAWGTRLYPDSLIVACSPELFRRLHVDPRLDTVSVRVERDVLPVSSGD